jgi:PHD/YefM family antitoxin component YafN of YafNO toxin-antitoxin module
MNRALKHFQSSELSRNSLKVFSAAEISPVLVTRRDGESLILMSEKEADAQSELFELAAQLIAVTIDNDGSLAERMAKHFPWMLALNAADRTQCADDLIRAGQAALSTGQDRKSTL